MAPFHRIIILRTLPFKSKQQQAVFFLACCCFPAVLLRWNIFLTA
jgi:hypothetical protein